MFVFFQGELLYAKVILFVEFEKAGLIKKKKKPWKVIPTYRKILSKKKDDKEHSNCELGGNHWHYIYTEWHNPYSKSDISKIHLLFEVTKEHCDLVWMV